MNKLYKKRKIELIEPSQEIQQSYINKSDSNLSSAKILLNAKKLEESISLAYYSMYHALTALLFRTGIKCENHHASILILKQIFGIDNTKILTAKKERIDKQYYVDFNIKLDEVKQQIITAEEFNATITNLIESLNNKNIEQYRKKLNNLSKTSQSP